jgi:beta-lactamase class D
VFSQFNSKKAALLDLSSFESYDYDFSMLVYDLEQNNYLYYNDSLINKNYTPASTFKIVNTIIGLENGIIDSANYLMKWDGIKRENTKWNADQTLGEAFRNSTIWYFQRLAKQIGQNKMQAGLELLNYGNKTIGDSIDQFWLDGTLKISMQDQVEFLTNLIKRKYKLKANTYDCLFQIMKYNLSYQYVVYCKTGWGQDSGQDVAWLVGMLIKNGKQYAFATLITTNDYKKMDLATLRYKIAMACFATLK